MKILMSAYTFDPSIGGIETTSSLLATEFVRLGHQVRLVTSTRESGLRDYSFEVIRRPPMLRQLELIRWADVYFQVHISLGLAWPLLLLRRPWVVSQQTWLAGDAESATWVSRLKRFLLRFATTVPISRAVADETSTSTAVIGNPYDESTFRPMPEIERASDLIFVGRLGPIKGTDLILKALAKLKSGGRQYRLTVVGPGDVQEQALGQLASELGIADQVTFAGPQTGPQLAALLNAHQVLVVPSRWREPFGIVALEGCACGCVVVGSAEGGLPEAIGPCGVTFPNGDVEALAGLVAELLSKPERLDVYRRASPPHLANHTARAIASAYIRVFESNLVKANHSN
jgi:glycosyltransferase involved in cell wall biosynthesis